MKNKYPMNQNAVTITKTTGKMKKIDTGKHQSGLTTRTGTRSGVCPWILCGGQPY